MSPIPTNWLVLACMVMLWIYAAAAFWVRCPKFGLTLLGLSSVVWMFRERRVT